MYPSPDFGHRYFWHARMHRGPSRIFWFAIGALTTAAYYRHHEKGGSYRRCVRDSDNGNVNNISAPATGGQNLLTAPSPPNPAPVHPQPSQNTETRSPQWGFNQQWDNRDWEENKERMTKLKQQAHETFTEVSESTLDGLISTVEALKSKLADHRAERIDQLRKVEEERKAAEQQQENAPRRWV